MRFFSIAMAAALVIFHHAASAAIVTVVPSSPTVEVGDTVVIDLVISGLGASGAPSLGAFALELGFDDAALAGITPGYSAFLGDPTDALETFTITEGRFGAVGFDNTSFLPESELNALQGASFTLVTLTFQGLAVGSTDLTLTLIDFADAAGADLTGTSAVDATLEVIAAASAPVPAPWLLILPGLLFAALKTRRKSLLIEG